MPSVLGHAAAALAITSAVAVRPIPKRLPAIAVACALAPDLDVVAFALGVPYEHPLGHRGLWHSIPFAAVFSLLVAWAAFGRSRAGPSPLRAWWILFLATASHGVLDAFTNGGLGVALFSPFDDSRVFFAFRPIQVSPIGIAAFFSEWGVAVLYSELLWIGVPSALVIALCARRGSAP